MQSIVSIYYHAISWPLTLVFCTRMGHDTVHSSLGIEGQLFLHFFIITQLVWPRSMPKKSKSGQLVQKIRVETDGRTWPIALPSPLMRMVTLLPAATPVWHRPTYVLQMAISHRPTKISAWHNRRPSWHVMTQQQTWPLTFLMSCFQITHIKSLCNYTDFP